MSKRIIITGLLCIVLAACTDQTKNKAEAQSPVINIADQIDKGRYLAIVSGCNDCHTDGYLMTEGKIPEEQWLAGTRIGWQGPWGTTYPSNLRLRVQQWTEDQWVETLKTRKALPPMPWMNISQMNEEDLRAIYQYIRSLGPTGKEMPLAVAPGVMPITPYLSLFPQNLPQANALEE